MLQIIQRFSYIFCSVGDPKIRVDIHILLRRITTHSQQVFTRQKIDIFIFIFYVRFVVGCFFLSYLIFNSVLKCNYANVVIGLVFMFFFSSYFFLDRHKTAMRFRPRRESGRAQAGMSTFFFYTATEQVQTSRKSHINPTWENQSD